MQPSSNVEDKILTVEEFIHAVKIKRSRNDVKVRVYMTDLWSGQECKMCSEGYRPLHTKEVGCDPV